MNILILLQKILGFSIMSNFADGAAGAADGSDSGSDGDGAGDDGSDKGSDGADDGDDKGAGKSDSDDTPKGDSPDDKFKRWKISQAKKEAAKKVVDGGQSDDSKKTDEDFEAYFEEKFNEKLKSLGLDKIDKIDEFETRFEKEEFFNQFKEAGSQYAEYGLSIDPVKGGEILADIESKGFTPAQLILLANADTIMGKLKGLPRAPMSTESGEKPNIDTSKMNMKDRLSVIKDKFGVK